ncbi:hypothetical protein KKG46_06090 [Patescibacteria group bacterium]|nr:hypothetical protein [Patescibacteria group bacterium]
MVTLDTAYDGGGSGAGRTIITDAGPILITNTTGTLGFMSVTHSTDAEGLWVDNLGNGDAFSARNQGSAAGFYSRNQGTGSGVRIDNNTNSGMGLYIDNAIDGLGLRLDNAGDNFGAAIYNNADGIGLHIQNSSSTGMAMYLRQNEGQGLVLDNNTVNNGIHVTNNSTGNGIFIDNQSSGRAMRITDVGNKTSFQIDKIVSGGNAIETYTDNGAKAFYITHNGDGESFWMRNQGTGASLWIEDAASDSTPFVLNSAGYLGIGTSTPTYYLDVNGDARVASQFMLGRYASLPGSGYQSGSILYNTSSSTINYWDGTQWRTVATASDVRSSLWDTDHDTGVQVEESADEDYIRFDTAGVERMFIQNDGKIGINTTGPLTAGLQIGQGGHMNAALSVNGTPGDTGIVAFRDEDGEDIFTALGSLANNDFVFMMGDIGNAYGNSYGGTTGISINQAEEAYIFGRAPIRLIDSGGGEYVGFMAPAAVTTSTIWTLPGHDGSNNQVLVTNGSGTLSWATSSDMVENIYTADGDLAGDRTVSGDGVGLGINTVNGGYFEVDVEDGTDYSFLHTYPDEMELSSASAAAYSSMVFNAGGASFNHSQSGSSTHFYIGSTMTLTDGINFRGVNYGADYSANYTARTLVDKGYVDNAIVSSTLSFDNGLVNNSGTVELGGALTKNTAIDLATFDLQFDSTNGYFKTTDDRTEFAYGDSYFTAEDVGFEVEAADENEIVNYYMRNNLFEISGYTSSSSINPNFHGATYGDDYSAYFVDRSLVDKEYVDNAITSSTVAAGNGLTLNSGVMNLGGDLLHNTYIEHQGYDLIIREFAGEPETLFSGDNFKIQDGSYEVRFGIGGPSSMGISFTNPTSSYDLFSFNNNIGIITDITAFQGLVYDKDYSSYYVDRSLVDKEYVDDHISSVTMQGAADNSIAADGYVMFDTGAAYWEDDGGAMKIEAKTGGYEIAMAEAGGSNLYFRSSAGVGNPADIKFIDNRTSGDKRGIEYHADYSADYTLRSLVDKAYVDNSIFAATTTLNLSYNGGGTALGRRIYTTGNSTPVEIINPGTDQWETSLALTNGANGGGLAMQTMESFGDWGSRLYFTDDTSDPVNGTGAYMYNDNTMGAFEFGYQTAGTRNSSFYIDYSQMALNIPGSQTNGAFSINASNYNVPVMSLRVPGSSGNNNITISVGTSTPETKVTAWSGSLFTRTDGVGGSEQLYVKTTDGGNTGWVPLSSSGSLSDLDGDTKIQVEESSDEDYIRFDTAGTERMYITNSGELHFADGGYVDAYFNIDNPSSPYTGDPSLAGIFLDSGHDRVSLFGTETYVLNDLGVGVANPNAKVDIGEGMITNPRGDMSVLLSEDGGDSFFETASGDMAEGLLMLGSPGNGWDYGVIRNISSSGYAAGWDRGLHIFTSSTGLTDDPIIFSTDSAERMRILDNGRIAIGSSTASSKLYIEAGDGEDALITVNSDDGNGNGNDAGLVINSDYSNGSDAAYVRFLNNGTQSGKMYSSPAGSGFIVDGAQSYDVTTNGQTRLFIAGAGNVGISTTTPGYRLDVQGDSRVSAQFMLGRYAVNPASGNQAGAIIYNTASSTPFVWDGSQWLPIMTGGLTSTGWMLAGNAGTNPGTDFIGTTDNKALYFKTNNTDAMLITEGGLVGIGAGVGIPSHGLEVASDDGFGFYDGAGDQLVEVSGNLGSGTARIQFGDAGGVDTETAFSIAPASSTFTFMHGDVGISTSSPAYRLDVVGDSRVSAQLMLGQYALNPASGNQAGAMVYNTASSTPFYWDGIQWVALGGAGATAGALWDTDHDTGIQIEESADEDIIRFDTAGTEYFTIQGPRLSVLNSGNSVFMGQDAGRVDDLTTNNNVFIGRSAGYSNTSGFSNVYIGYEAGYAATTQESTVAIGREAGRNNTGAFGNTMLGYFAGSSNTGNDNVMIGYESGVGNTGGDNFFMGRGTGWNNTGSQNIMMGYFTGYDNKGSSNILFGSNAGSSNKGSNGIFMGANAGYDNIGNDNIFLGYNTGFKNATGTRNLFLGREAGHSNVLGNGNIFLGYQAGYSETNSDRLYIDNSNTASPLIYGEFDNNVVRVNGTMQVNNPATTGYAFPTADGASYGLVLATDANGAMYWSTTTQSNHLKKVTNVLSPIDSAVYQFSVTNNSPSTLTGFKAVNTNDFNNYAGAVLELKGSGADYTNNLYFGKYGNGFYIPSWAGNGVVATDRNLVIGAVSSTSIINFQVGGTYSAPVSRLTLDTNSLDLQSGVNLNVAANATISGQFMLGQYALNPASGNQSGSVIYNTASSTPFFWDGSNWIAFATGTADALNLQQVTDNGYTTDNAIVFAGATSSGDILPYTHDTYSLGNSGYRWSDIWGSNIHIGTSTWDLAQAANGSFTLSSGGDEKMRVQSNGYVGIGTDQPEKLLSLDGGDMLIGQFNGAVAPIGGYSRQMIIRATDGQLAGIQGTAYTTYQRNGVDIAQVGIDTSNNIAFRNYTTSWATNVVISSSGNMGIGDTTPTRKLDIQGSTTPGDNLFRVGGGVDGGYLSVYTPSSDDRNTTIEWQRNLNFHVNGSDAMVIANDGNVGIGTGAAAVNSKLQLSADNSASDASLLRFQASNDSDIQSEIYFSNGGNATYWDINSSGAGGALIMMNESSEIAKFTNSGFVVNDGSLSGIDFRVESDANTHAMFVDATNGYVGFDQSVPLAKLHIGNTAAGSLADYDYLRMVGSGDVSHRVYLPNGSNLMVWDFNTTGNGGAIEFRDHGARVGMFTNSGLVINDGAASNIGLRVEGRDDANLFYTDASNNKVGIGTNSPAVKFHVIESGDIVAAFDRTTNDGTIISLRQAGVEEGTISVSANTVSYNAFTGSHYAWTDDNIQKGMLVSLTGQNKYLHNNPMSEILYGIEVTSIVNDSRVMGSYLALQEAEEARDENNPHLVMAVGNGEVWVTDKGENINIGDYLISSDVAGHAQQDTGEFIVSHIVARAAESIDWTHVSEQFDGVKHKKISVFFETFDKNNIHASVAGTSLQGGDNLDVEDLIVGSAVFEGTITVKEHAAFGKDTVGQAMIMSGEKRVKIDFVNDYGTLPIVTLTPANKVSGAYWVENASLQGFEIVVDELQPSEVMFNWHAFGNFEGRVYVSNGTTLEITTNDMGSSALETEIQANGSAIVPDPVENTDVEPDSDPPATQEAESIIQEDASNPDEVSTPPAQQDESPAEEQSEPVTQNEPTVEAPTDPIPDVQVDEPEVISEPVEETVVQAPVQEPVVETISE